MPPDGRYGRHSPIRTPGFLSGSLGSYISASCLRLTSSTASRLRPQPPPPSARASALPSTGAGTVRAGPSGCVPLLAQHVQPETAEPVPPPPAISGPTPLTFNHMRARSADMSSDDGACSGEHVAALGVVSAVHHGRMRASPSAVRPSGACAMWRESALSNAAFLVRYGLAFQTGRSARCCTAYANCRVSICMLTVWRGLLFTEYTCTVYCST